MTRNIDFGYVLFLLFMLFIAACAAVIGIGFAERAGVLNMDTLAGQSAWNERGNNGFPLDYDTPFPNYIPPPSQHAINKHGDDALKIYLLFTAADAATRCPPDRIKAYYHGKTWNKDARWIVRCWIDGVNDAFTVVGMRDNGELYNFTNYPGEWADTYSSMMSEGGWVEIMAR